MITGTHAILYSTDPDATRAFFRNVLDMPSVDAGEGWLIFALPPAELGVHPADEPGRHELYFTCDDVDATVADLVAKGAEITEPVAERRWGRHVTVRIPGGGEIGVYQPHHAIAPR